MWWRASRSHSFRIEGAAMGIRRRVLALVAGVAVAAGAFAVAVAGQGTSFAAVACSGTVWAEGVTYTAGQQVTYNGHLYQALVTHTAYVGAGWNPAATPSLWKDLGTCTGGGTTSPTPSATRSPSPSPSPSRSATASPTPSKTPSKTPSQSPTGGSCGVRSRPA